MTTDNQHRAADALRALGDGEELARHRVWRRVRAGAQRESGRSLRVRWTLATAALGTAAAAAIIVAGVIGSAGGASDAPPDDRASVQGLAQMLGADGAASIDDDAAQQFVLQFATEQRSAAE